MAASSMRDIFLIAGFIYYTEDGIVQNLKELQDITFFFNFYPNLILWILILQ